MYFIALLLILWATSLSAFDFAGETPGAVPRPGHDRQSTVSAGLGVVGSGNVYRINVQSGTPRAVSANYRTALDIGNPAALAGEFIGRFGAAFAGIDPVGFRFLSSRLVLGKFHYLEFRQTYEGIEVWGSHLGLRVTPDGNVFFGRGELFPGIDIDPAPAIEAAACRTTATRGIDFNPLTDKIADFKLVVLPLIFDSKIDYRLCWLFEINTESPPGEWQAFVDANTGELVWRENRILYERIAGDVSGLIQPTNPYESQVDGPFANNHIYIDNAVADTTDSAGRFGFDITSPGSVTLDLYLRGPFMRVVNMNDNNAFYTSTVSPGDSVQVHWDDGNSTLPQRNAFYHGQAVHDYIKLIDPDLTAMDFQMVCRVNVDGSCNAFYSRTDRSINFYREGGGCPNIALIADVVHHEYGHGLTNLQYDAGGAQDPNGAMHEGFSDFLAAIVTGQPLIGRGFFGPGTYLRTVDNNRRYPIHWNGESHNDGQIIAGALWDLREMLASRPGYAETLWQYAKYGYAPDFESYFWDVLVTDDDDGNIDNGTPHAYEIFYSFGNLHGIGPGVQINITHTPLTDTEDSLHAYQVQALIDGVNSFDSGQVRIHYFVAGDSFTLPMTNGGGDDWFGSIPAQPFGTVVDYYIEAIDNLGFRGTSPADAPAVMHSFYVGYDTIPPLIESLFLPRNSVRLHGPFGPFIFRANDIHGIDSGSGLIEFAVNFEAVDTAAVLFSDSADAFILYSLNPPRVLQFGDTIRYRFFCRDNAYLHNLAVAPSAGHYTIAASPEELVDDFENGNLNWHDVSPGWVIIEGQGYQSPHSLRTGTGNYENNLNALICNRTAYNFTLFDSASLSFRTRYLVAEGDTCFVVAARSLSGPWTRLASFTGASQWRQIQVDLSSFCGVSGATVYFGFNFISDESGSSYGVLIDNVTLAVAAPTAIGDIVAEVPTAFAIEGIYPNPFNSRTQIDLMIPERQRAQVDIYDLLGRLIRRVETGEIGAGRYRISWDGRNDRNEPVGSGIYFVRAQAGRYSDIKAVTLIK